MDYRNRRRKTTFLNMLCLLLALILLTGAAAAEEVQIPAVDALLIERSMYGAELFGEMAASSTFRQTMGLASSDLDAAFAELAAVDFGAPQKVYVCSVKAAIEQFADMLLLSDLGYTNRLAYAQGVFQILETSGLLGYAGGRYDASFLTDYLVVPGAYAPDPLLDRAYYVLICYDNGLAVGSIFVPEDDLSMMAESAPVWLCEAQQAMLAEEGLAALLRDAGLRVSAQDTCYDGAAVSTLFAE